MKKIVVIAALSHPEYKEKVKRNKKITKPVWDCALLKNKKPVDFVDFYKSKSKTANIRHIYNNGIVLYNFFRNKKCDVHLINTFNDISEKDTKKISQSDYVIFSTGYPGYGDRLKNIINTVKKIRKYNLKAKIVIGGWEIYRVLKVKNDPYYQSFLKKLHEAGANLVIGSRQGLDVIWKSIEKSPDFQGIIYDNQDYPPVNPKLYNISSLPKKFHSLHTAVTTTDGCHFSCNFCSYKLLHDKVKHLSIKNTKQILINLHKGRSQPLRHIRFADECFNYPAHRILKICQMINSLKFKFNWSCFIRMGNINKEIVQAMKKAGCSFVSIGLESGDYKMRLRMNKIVTDQEILKTIKLFKQAGIKVATSLIVGYYGENEKTIQTTKELLEKTKPDIARINIWYPIQHEFETANAHKFSFEWTKNGWSHSTMNEKQAYETAAWLYKNTKGIIFSPPFTSIFDLLPWLQGEGLDEKESFKIIKEYYLESLK